uniref:Sphingomyelin synthase-related protein 1-like isoform X2 n=1 Tax=Crassostrea virginica TaxID=6565 RepID=A0A8B8DJR7_CRAVI|nr:sphingomyelin synthase-related protein 1-like isoform X2 [Crassostrea virginica]
MKKKKRTVRSEMEPHPRDWNNARVGQWLKETGFEQYQKLFDDRNIDGGALCRLTEETLQREPLNISIADVHRLSVCIQQLQQRHDPSGKAPDPRLFPYKAYEVVDMEDSENSLESDRELLLGKPDDNQNTVYYRRAHSELRKTILAMMYGFLSHFLTSVAIVNAQEKLPDKKQYPPLPDIYLDNFAVIPWAYKVSESVILSLLALMGVIFVFHKHRWVVLRRTLVIAGSIYILRCVCVTVTNLPMPEKHYKCDRMVFQDTWSKFQRILVVYSGMGMKIGGMKTCGDYMFSGHTITITVATLTAIEYTPKRYRLLHVALWLYCFCGMWAILASHGHYTLDVVIAFYIASRIFMYHQTFANNLSLMRRNRKRIKIWFPVFYFFEKDTHGIVKNEYECPLPSLDAIRKFIKDRRVDFCLKQYTPFRHS